MKSSQQLRQKILQKVYNHLKKQGKKSTTKTKICKYRLQQKDGTVLKCAMGCLIKDKYYKPEFEGITVDSQFYSKGKDKKIHTALKTAIKTSNHIKRWTKPLEKFLQKIQDVHDIYEPKEWELEFIKLSHEYNLTLKLPGKI